jgi:ABC-type phosphate transport system substrate-binding protein
MHNDASGVLTQLNSVFDSRELVSALTIGIVTFIGGLVYGRFRKNRLITWTVLYDEPINRTFQDAKGDKSQDMWEISFQGDQIDDGSLAVLDIRCAGQDGVSETDFAGLLTFRFPGREVVHFKVRDSEDVREKTQKTPVEEMLPPNNRSRIVMPPLALNSGESFKLMVLLKGTAADTPESVTGTGKLKGGEVIRRTRRKRRLWAYAGAVAATLLLLIGLTAGTWVANGAITPDPTCAAGGLLVEGSTAFAPIARNVANAYEDKCPGANITVAPIGSGPGLDELKKNPRPGTIAMTDGLPAGSTTGLTMQPAGLVFFAVVANKSLTLSGLTTGQLRALFQAQPSTGNGNVVVVGRASGSGTRTTFEENVLGARTTDFPAWSRCPLAPVRKPVACTVETTMDLLTYINRTPNAIGYAEADALPYFPNVAALPINGTLPTRAATLKGAYRFVATEYLYTAGQPHGLTAGYLDFLKSDALAAQLRDRDYVGCSELSGTALSGQCH